MSAELPPLPEPEIPPGYDYGEGTYSPSQVRAAIAAAVAAERERCARVCEGVALKFLKRGTSYHECADGADECAEAIRATPPQ